MDGVCFLGANTAVSLASAPFLPVRIKRWVPLLRPPPPPGLHPDSSEGVTGGTPKCRVGGASYWFGGLFCAPPDHRPPEAGGALWGDHVVDEGVPAGAALALRPSLPRKETGQKMLT